MCIWTLVLLECEPVYFHFRALILHGSALAGFPGQRLSSLLPRSLARVFPCTPTCIIYLYSLWTIYLQKGTGICNCAPVHSGFSFWPCLHSCCFQANPLMKEAFLIQEAGGQWRLPEIGERCCRRPTLAHTLERGQDSGKYAIFPRNYSYSY